MSELNFTEARIERSVRRLSREELQTRVAELSAQIKEAKAARAQVIASLDSNGTRVWLVSMLENRIKHLMMEGQAAADVMLSMPTPKDSTTTETQQ